MRKSMLIAAAAGLVGLLAFVGCVGGLKGLRFSHRDHASEAPCADCHKGGARAGHEACVACHEIQDQKPSEACLSCHTQGDYRVEASRPKSYADVVFDHGAHDAVDCQRCHAGAARSREARDTNLPAMEVCTVCHDGGEAPAECSTCHRELRKDVAPATHTSAWPRQHGSLAKQGERACAFCHAKTGCDDCHTTRRPESHTPAWKNSTHGIEADHDRTRCTTCHRADYCSRCHEMRPPSHFGANFRIPLSDGQGHGRLALDRGARSCLVCHEQSFCLQCHPAGR